MWNLKDNRRNVSMEQKKTHRHREQTCVCQGGEAWERDGVGSLGKLLYTDWVNNKVLQY